LTLKLCNPRGTPYNGLYRKAPPERGTIFTLHAYKRVGISLIEVYERGGKGRKRASSGISWLGNDLKDILV